MSTGEVNTRLWWVTSHSELQYNFGKPFRRRDGDSFKKTVKDRNEEKDQWGASLKTAEFLLQGCKEVVAPGETGGGAAQQKVVVRFQGVSTRWATGRVFRIIPMSLDSNRKMSVTKFRDKPGADSSIAGGVAS
jgi:hypothetical protein